MALAVLSLRGGSVGVTGLAVLYLCGGCVDVMGLAITSVRDAGVLY
jgi:hypothetical protein